MCTYNQTFLKSPPPSPCRVTTVFKVASILTTVATIWPKFYTYFAQLIFTILLSSLGSYFTTSSRLSSRSRNITVTVSRRDHTCFSPSLKSPHVLSKIPIIPFHWLSEMDTFIHNLCLWCFERRCNFFEILLLHVHTLTL